MSEPKGVTLDTNEQDDEGRVPVVLDAPESIWLNYGDIEQDCNHSDCDEVTWCSAAQGPSDIRYVRAERLEQAEAKVRAADRVVAAANAVHIHWQMPMAMWVGDYSEERFDEKWEELRASLLDFDRAGGGA